MLYNNMTSFHSGPPGPPAGIRLDRNTITTTSAVVIWTEGETHGRPTQFHNIEACTEHNNTWVPVYTRNNSYIIIKNLIFRVHIRFLVKDDSRALNDVILVNDVKEKVTTTINR